MTVIDEEASSDWENISSDEEDIELERASTNPVPLNFIPLPLNDPALPPPILSPRQQRLISTLRHEVGIKPNVDDVDLRVGEKIKLSKVSLQEWERLRDAVEEDLREKQAALQEELERNESLMHAPGGEDMPAEGRREWLLAAEMKVMSSHLARQTNLALIRCRIREVEEEQIRKGESRPEWDRY